MASTIARQIDRGRRRVAPFLTLRSLIAICSAIALLPLLTVVQRSEAERADARPSASAVPSYKASVLSDDPSNYYRLDETGGTTAADSSGNGNNGTYSASGISYGVSGALAAGGDSDTAVSVSATANVTAALPSSLNDIWPVATLEGWVQTTTNSAETNLFGFTNGGSVNDDATAAWLQDSGGTPEFLLTNNSGGTNVQSTAFTLPDKYWDGSWHMFDVVYYGDDGNVEPLAVYWDGQFLGSPGASAFDGSWATFNGLTFGNVPGLASGVSENLDELAVYPTALSGSRIDAHFTAAQSSPPFSAPCPPKPTSLYASTVLTDTPSLYYRTDDAAYGRVAFDSSGNCTASSPTNATYSSAGISTDPHGALAQGGDNDGAISLTKTANMTPPLSGSQGNAFPVTTIEGWVQTATSTAEANLFGFTNNGTVNDNATAAWLEDVGGNPEFVITNDSGGPTVLKTTFTLPESYWDDSWHLFDIVFSGDVGNAEPIDVYWDGQFLGAPTPQNPFGEWSAHNGLTFGNVPGLGSG